MEDWYYKAARELDSDLENGDITESEYKRAMQDLDNEIQEEYEENRPYLD